MSFPTELDAIAGARELHQWFGYWPTFHDTEILHLHLNGRGPSSLAVHTWEMTDEVDAKGFYVLRKRVVVDFSMTGISKLTLDGCSPASIAFGISIGRKDNGFELALDPSYGLAGTIVAAQVEIQITPGNLSRSSHAKRDGRV